MMKNEVVPKGYHSVIPYLILPNGLDFSNFMKKVFGAIEGHTVMTDEQTVRHAQIQIGDSTIMFADSSAEFPPMPAGLFVYVYNTDDCYQKALLEGATSVMPPSNQEYGRTCGVKDPFGNTWWITSVVDLAK